MRYLPILLFAFVATACHPTNSARCDRQIPGQAIAVEQAGGWLRCDPSYDSDEPANATLVVQWNRYRPDGTREPQAWLWERRIDDRWLQLDAWALVYEVRAWRAGRVPTWYLDVQKWGVPADVERDAFQWAAQRVR